jgi:hypothetical protein
MWEDEMILLLNILQFFSLAPINKFQNYVSIKVFAYELEDRIKNCRWNIGVARRHTQENKNSRVLYKAFIPRATLKKSNDV